MVRGDERLTGTVQEHVFEHQFRVVVDMVEVQEGKTPG